MDKSKPTELSGWGPAWSAEIPKELLSVKQSRLNPKDKVFSVSNSRGRGSFPFLSALVFSAGAGD